MVSKGQYLERPTLVPVDGLVLEGLWHRGSEPLGLLIVPPLPDDGSMDHVAAAELAFHAATHGFPSLRFNFRGVGASQGPRDVEAATADAAAALELARENLAHKAAPGEAPVVAVAGIGSGAVIAAQLALQQPVAGCLLVAPPRLSPLPRGVWVVVAGLEPPVEGLEAAVKAASGRTEVVQTDRGFQRNLPQVGKIAVGWLTEAAMLRKH